MADKKEKKDKKIIFDCFITGYLDKDERIISFLQSYKLKKKNQSKRNMKIINKDNEKAEDLLSQFGIKDSELENIFDLIAKEHPEL